MWKMLRIWGGVRGVVTALGAVVTLLRAVVTLLRAAGGMGAGMRWLVTLGRGMYRKVMV